MKIDTAKGKKKKRTSLNESSIKQMTVRSNLPEGAEIVDLSEIFVQLFRKHIEKNLFKKADSKKTKKD
ncbi:hypothetical protein V8G57_15470 [Collimonas sp. H4R21]|uniref:Uncharacterized protein n=1 Tax=Collimonas rhizosphaerae TaxID=3126357 RepID=A0ABU9PXY2_9BURK